MPEEPRKASESARPFTRWQSTGPDDVHLLFRGIEDLADVVRRHLGRAGKHVLCANRGHP
eukprot:6187063-Pleurochrysis_carterae.AAC.1